MPIANTNLLEHSAKREAVANDFRSIGVVPFCGDESSHRQVLNDHIESVLVECFPKPKLVVEQNDLSDDSRATLNETNVACNAYTSIGRLVFNAMLRFVLRSWFACPLHGLRPATLLCLFGVS